MVGFPLWAVVLLVAIGAAGVLAVLHSLASSIRNDRNVHDLLVDASRLRATYMRRLEHLAEEVGVNVGDLTDVEILD